jgi:hypothetical protein
MAIKAAFQIDIPKRATTCAHSGKEFEPGSNYHSVVFEEGDAYGREDYSQESWNAGAKEAATCRTHIHWIGRVPQKKPKSRFEDVSRTQAAMTVLREALSAGRHDEAFILGLYLHRKRQIFPRKKMPRDGLMVQLYEVAKTEEILAIPVVSLSTLQVNQIQLAVAAKLGGETPNATPLISEEGAQEQNTELGDVPCEDHLPSADGFSTVVVESEDFS